MLRPGGIIYTITDVRNLHNWMAHHLNQFPLFEYIPTEELEKVDPIVDQIRNATEEGKKVTRNNGEKFVACFRRLEKPLKKPPKDFESVA